MQPNFWYLKLRALMLFAGSHKEMSSILADQQVLVYERWGGGGVYGVSANEYSSAHGAHGDLTPYLTYCCLLCCLAATLKLVLVATKH
jgi:hypothetical protein